ncbi:uncharacterized protein ARB_01494 [Trichophyton benhamiae CBS 112371]|uniref:Uncharacterized protein n=1 Tax=Arthroderma benhamiae (strain ATCC MYA-4681 / CBS 112371) TaxID=663331 RepID=D4AZ74_ARTBC|nr:uncharacterized protein ARB_01494 [Trichophyton benhamiae CBS 112371]EFE31594.1 hypothetical protein ARB_01494 [Trichophyton benhamiae CBS 112371]
MKRYIGLGVGSNYTYHIPPNLLQISVGSVTSPGQVLLSVVSQPRQLNYIPPGPLVHLPCIIQSPLPLLPPSQIGINHFTRHIRQAEGNLTRQVRLPAANMMSGQGSHFTQANTGKKKKKTKGKHRLAPAASKPVAIDESKPQVASAIADARASSDEKESVEKPRPLSFSKDPANVSGTSANLTQGAHGPPSPTWSAEDSKLGVHNDHNAASRAAANAALFGKRTSYVEEAQSQRPLSSTRATETPRRDSSTLGAAHRTEMPIIGAFPADGEAEAADRGPDASSGNEAVEKEEGYNAENKWEENVADTVVKVDSDSKQQVASGIKEKNEWVKEETEEGPGHTAHVTRRHSEVTEYVPPTAAAGVPGKHIERIIEKDTVEKEIIEKPVDTAASEAPAQEQIPEPAAPKPSYAAVAAKVSEQPPAPVAPVAHEAPVQTQASAVPAEPAASKETTPAPAPAAAPVPVPAPIPVPLMKQQEHGTAEKANQTELVGKEEAPPATTAHEVPTAEELGVAAPAVPAKAPDRLITTDPVIPGKVPALASSDEQVKAAVESSSTVKPPATKESVQKRDEAQISRLTSQQRREVEKEEKAREKQKAKEQKARDKEFRKSQKHLRKGAKSELPPGNGGAKRLRLRDRIMNRIARLLS